MPDNKRILITGAAGYIGHQVGNVLAQANQVVGCDIRPNPKAKFEIKILYIGDPALADLMQVEQITHVIHLASVLDASDDRERDFRIDVTGTQNVLDAAIAAGVEHVTVTSSGAAYGYHADNAAWLSEQDPIRGNYEFAYSWHKRLVEEMLAKYRELYPNLQQLILRPGTVLGSGTRNLITNLFLKKRILTLRGADSPFVFIWDQDVVNIIQQGVLENKTGIYNLAGDGALTLKEIAQLLHKPSLVLPVSLVTVALWVAKRLRLGRYGPEQVNFLRYRPVLSNQALKTKFGYIPQKTSAQVFQFFASHLNDDNSHGAHR